MSRFCFKLAVFLMGCLFLIPSVNADADDATVQVTVPKVIITPVPQPKEVVVEPQGYVSCTTAPAGWYDNEWRPERRVCQYNYTPGTANTTIQGTTWIAGYWGCNQYKVGEDGNGVCTNWDWRPGHWEASSSIQY